MTVKMSVKDNLKLTKVIVELDGKEYKSWSGEELEAIIQNQYVKVIFIFLLLEIFGRKYYTCACCKNKQNRHGYYH